MRLRLFRECLMYPRSRPDLWISNEEAIAMNFMEHEAAVRKNPHQET